MDVTNPGWNIPKLFHFALFTRLAEHYRYSRSLCVFRFNANCNVNCCWASSFVRSHEVHFHASFFFLLFSLLCSWTIYKRNETTFWRNNSVESPTVHLLTPSCYSNWHEFYFHFALIALLTMFQEYTINGSRMNIVEWKKVP